MQSGSQLLDEPTKRRLKRIVIVDDCPITRGWLKIVLDQDHRLVVVGEAASADEARQVIKREDPDAITLDIEMPGMNGLSFLSRLMKLYPLPVVMISGATESTSNATVTALSLGAVDCILKPTEELTPRICGNITQRVYAAANSRPQPFGKKPMAPQISTADPTAHSESIVLIGASTGGVTALEAVLSQVDPNGPAIVVVQHMPAPFLESFVKSLNKHLPLDVGLVQEGQELGHGEVRFAPEIGRQTILKRRNFRWMCQFTPNDRSNSYCPSVDDLFRSATPYAPAVIAVILTGLGRDGAEGMLQLHQAGARTIGQDEKSSTVYGMPKAAWSLGGVQKQYDLAEIGNAISMAAAAAPMHKRHRIGPMG